jgi:hypothetical protein
MSMTQVIKFRAFEKATELMHEVIVWFKDEYVAIPEVGPDGWELSKRKLKDVEIMQFTGLYSEDDKEIFDKDIVQEKQGIFIIDITDFEAMKIHQQWQGSYRILGNVYSNPELLGVVNM